MIIAYLLLSASNNREIAKDDVIYSCGAGIYGTKEGLEQLGNFYQNVESNIASECDPQEIYFYSELYFKVHDYACTKLKGEKFEYYFNITD